MNSLARSPHPSLEKLRTFGLGQLDAAEASVVEEHVSHCDVCCRTLAEVGSDTFTDLLRVARRATPDVRTTAAPTEGLAAGTPSASAADGRTSAAAPVEPAADLPPELLQHPRYRVLGLLGTGGMGAVYKAEHRLMERVVALKVMTRGLVGSAATVERFRREFKASARLSHPNIVAAYDGEQAGDLPFLVMEYVEGTDLARWVAERGPLPAAEACEYVRQAALGLQHAHEHGMIHRDIKPHNLMRTPDGTVKILDFGLARLVADANSAQGGVTGQGIVLGTVDYLAPEQADDARQADIRSDLYSLGCTLYHLLSGRPPFPQGTAVQKLMAHSEREPVSLEECRPDLAPGLARVVSRMMAKLPEDRFQTPAEVCAALARFAGQTVVLDPAALRGKVSGGSRRRRWPVGVAALLLALVGLAAAVAVYRIQTDNGELIITTDNPDVEVVIKQNGKLVRILDTKTNKEVKLESGLYDLELKGNPEELKLSLDKVTIRRGETAVATVERRPQPVVEKLGEVRRFLGHDGTVRAVAYSADGRYALSGSGWPAGDSTVRLWNVATGKEVRRFEGHAGYVSGVALSADGRRALSGHEDRTVRLWDVGTGKEVRSFEGHEHPVLAVAFSPDGRRALSGSQDRTIRLWDVETGREVRKFEGHNGWVVSVAFSPDGRRAASGGRDSTLRLWEVETGKELRCFEGHTENGAVVAYSPDGRFLLSGGADKSVRLWDVETGKEMRALLGHAEVVTNVALSPDGRRALSGSWDSTVRLWDVETGKELHCFKGHLDAVWGVAFSPDGRYALSGSGGSRRDGQWDVGRDWTLRLWRLPAPPEEKVGEVRRFEGHRGGIIGLSYAPDGRHVLSTSYDLTVRLWDVPSGKEVRRFEGHTAWPYTAVLSPDGRHVLSGGDDLVLRIWDAQSGKELRQGEGHTRGITWVAVSPDGRRALTGSWDGTIRLWKVESGEQLRVLEGHTAMVQSVAFSPDGKRALSAGGDRTVRLWDLEAGKELRSLEGHTGQVVSASFSPDGRRVLSGGLDKTLRLWDVDTGKQVRCLEGHTSPVLGVAFTPDGRHAFSAASPEGDEEGERGVRVWDLETGKELHRLETGAATRMAVSPDGRYALLAFPDHPDPRLWRLPALPAPTE
jgi:WD40 repeat protein/serine/threonine protein kinase